MSGAVDRSTSLDLEDGRRTFEVVQRAGGTSIVVPMCGWQSDLVDQPDWPSLVALDDGAGVDAAATAAD
jgi:hypothetical protein